MIVILIASVVSAAISSAITRHYFPRILGVENIIEKIVQVDRIVEKIIEVEKIVEVEKSIEPVISDVSEFSSLEDRRIAIALLAHDPAVLAGVSESIRRRDKAFGGLPPNPESQANPNRNIRGK